MPVLMPWLICWMIEPAMPLWFNAKIPKVQKPRWLTEEYATNFFQSACIRLTNAPYRIPMIYNTASTVTIVWSDEALGSSGNENRMNP